MVATILVSWCFPSELVGSTKSKDVVKWVVDKWRCGMEDVDQAAMAGAGRAPKADERAREEDRIFADVCVDCRIARENMVGRIGSIEMDVNRNERGRIKKWL